MTSQVGPKKNDEPNKELKNVSTGRKGIVFVSIGVLMLVLSLIDDSTLLAYIGTSITFLGVLLFLLRPEKYVKGSLLEFTSLPSYKTLDRMIEDLGCRGKPLYLPPYPEKTILPEYLAGIREAVVFIPTKDTNIGPTIDELVQKRYFLKNSKGICIVPPGSEFMILLQALGLEFSGTSLNQIDNRLSEIIVNTFGLAKSFNVNLEKGLFHVRIVSSVFMDLYTSKLALKSVHVIGCPLTSAIACALAKMTGKLVAIADIVTADSQITEVWYQIVGA